MKKANVEKIEQMAADYLQYRFSIVKRFESDYKEGEANPDLLHYKGACDMIQAIGGEWRRNYTGEEGNKEQLADANNYSHWVKLPDDKMCDKLNVDMWK